MNNKFDSRKHFPGGTKDFSDEIIMDSFKITMQLLCVAGTPFGYKNEAVLSVRVQVERLIDPNT